MPHLNLNLCDAPFKFSNLYYALFSYLNNNLFPVTFFFQEGGVDLPSLTPRQKSCQLLPNQLFKKHFFEALFFRSTSRLF